MIKKNALICISLFASLIALPGFSFAQFVLPTPPQEVQKPEEAAPPAASAPAVPDDVRLILMIRNAVIALNQANTTGNYTVLREMGTVNFQMTNSSAKLAEVFAALRARKVDLSPVMVFNPKLTSAPALQDGQVLRLTGYFPTAPEQVHFDLAYQHNAGQWQLAGIAINVALPDEAQASAAPASPLAQAAPEPAGGAAKPGEAKPIRIDMSQPAPASAKPAAKKPAAVKKPKPPAEKTAAAQGAASPPAAEAPAPVAKPAPQSAESSSSWNPFGR